MSERRISPARGRELFGADPQGYDRARPDYPERIYDVLRGRCGLAPGTATLEIGAGTGTATRSLVALGASPLVALEPDPRLAAYLKDGVGAAADVRTETFEDAALGSGVFDLVVGATSFHWLEQQSGLAKIALVLRPGGWLALFWHVFGDPERADPFHDESADLLNPHRASPSQGERSDRPFALDAEARVRDLRAVGHFEQVRHERIRWTAALDPEQIRALYATFSPIAELPAREHAHVLDELERIARDRFGGRVERPFVTALYTARRRD